MISVGVTEFVEYNCEVYCICLDNEDIDPEIEVPIEETVSNDDLFSPTTVI